MVCKTFGALVLAVSFRRDGEFGKPDERLEGWLGFEGFDGFKPASLVLFDADWIDFLFESVVRCVGCSRHISRTYRIHLISKHRNHAFRVCPLPIHPI